LEANTGWVRVSGLTKHYGTFAALEDVSFSVRRDEILGLIGPNGAGKTTLFECMAGVLPPSAGSILVANRAVAANGRSELLQDLFPEDNPVLRPPVAGKIGLWAKTDSTSLFKDYVVSPK
jgi:ABC-type multidrug transport system ATPase subunit